MTNKREPIPEKMLMAVYEGHGRVCALTKLKEGAIIIDPVTQEKIVVTLDIDHIKPVAQGGKNEIENLVPVWSRLNRARNCFSYDDLLIRRHKKNYALALDHYNRLMKKQVKIVKAPQFVRDVRNYSERFVSDANIRWTVKHVLFIVRMWIWYGKKSLEKAAQAVGRTVRSLICKLANMGLYTEPFFEGKN